MAQTTGFNIANSGGAVFRSRINEVSAALQSSNSGATAPTATAPGMLWFDTSVTPGIMKQRNNADDGWVTLLTTATGATAAQGALADSALQSADISADADFTVDPTKLASRAAIKTLVDTKADPITFTDVTGSRAHSTSYQNTSGKTKLVKTTTGGAGAVYVQTSPDNSTWTNVGVCTASGLVAWGNMFPVPNGSYWRINGTATIVQVLEAII